MCFAIKCYLNAFKGLSLSKYDWALYKKFIVLLTCANRTNFGELKSYKSFEWRSKKNINHIKQTHCKISVGSSTIASVSVISPSMIPTGSIISSDCMLLLLTS